MIYLDYASSTPVDPRVAQKMMAALEVMGNPSSTHAFGQFALQLVEEARKHVADLIDAKPSEIIFTSGATESNNLAIKGAATMYQRKGKHIITMKTEHVSVLETCQALEKQGYFVTYLSPDQNGRLDLQALEAAICPDTILVSVMHVNNETGVIQDLAAIAEMTSQKEILLHVDAAQSAGKIPLSVRELPMDLVSFSAHKLYGPKGIGALYLRQKPRVRVTAQQHGGGHEKSLRPGTLPTHQIVGMGEACRIAKAVVMDENRALYDLRELFWGGLKDRAIALNGHFTTCYPGILNIRFHDHTAEEIMRALPMIACSSGSACHASTHHASPVLRAMGFTDQEARRSIRFSYGRFTTEADLMQAVQSLQYFLQAGEMQIK